MDAAYLFAGLAKRPAVVAIEMQMTSQGCNLLIERWLGLQELLEPGKPWDESARSVALDMLGVIPELRHARTRIDPKIGEDVVEFQNGGRQRSDSRKIIGAGEHNGAAALERKAHLAVRDIGNGA